MTYEELITGNGETLKNIKFLNAEDNIPIKLCPCHPPITAFKILVDDNGLEISRERVGPIPNPYCPHCGELWTNH